MTIKGNNSSTGYLKILVMFDWIVDLSLLNISAVYSLSLSIIIFKIMSKNSRISLKLPIQGQQPNNRLSDSSENFRADRSWSDKQFYPHVRFALNSLVFELQAKNCILALCSIFSRGGHLNLMAGSSDTFWKLDTTLMEPGEDFFKS